MKRATPAVLSTGLVSAVGLTASATCAAVRSKISNPCLTGFVHAGKPIMGHLVPLERPWRGGEKLARMAAMAAEEALEGVPRAERERIPLLLCLAEAERPGRIQGSDDTLFGLVQRATACGLPGSSRVLANGRTGVPMALALARTMMAAGPVSRVLIVAVDTLLTARTVAHYAHDNRVLMDDNSNGFMPGEAAGAILLGHPPAGQPHLLCAGFGFAEEHASLASQHPLRGEGLATAIKAALADAETDIDSVDCRIADLSGEQYYFKEASLGLTRTHRRKGDNPELWHPAESVGEVGAASGAICLAVAHAAMLKQYLPGMGAVLMHFSGDAGARAAVLAVPGT
jgi:3-oxoacyl-[acyl-carrier-protein] synthase I